LEDICLEKSVWLKDVVFEHNGQLVRRKQGEKVHLGIMPA
jgi:hypothetical protein